MYWCFCSPRRGGASHEQICDFGIMGMWYSRVPQNHHDLQPLHVRIPGMALRLALLTGVLVIATRDLTYATEVFTAARHNSALAHARAHCLPRCGSIGGCSSVDKLSPWLASPRRHQPCHFRKRATSVPAEGHVYGVQARFRETL